MTTARKRKPTPAVHILTANILRVWEASTDDERNAGRDWYGEASNLARELDPQNPRRAAGVIAALSPQLSWTRNADLACRLYGDGSLDESHGLGANIRKANRIHAGEDPDEILGGHKVRAFFSNIADPAASPAVTVDRHAHDVARGRRYSDAERVAKSGLSSPRIYGAFVAAYERAANEVGATPLQIQATTWVTWRRIHGIES